MTGLYASTVTLEIQPAMEPEGGPRACSIADALEILGDRWSLLVVRECSYGVHRFSDIQRNTGAATDILTSRLKRLEAAGILRRERYSARPVRHQYFLTDAGRELFPVLLALREWGERQLHPGVAPVNPVPDTATTVPPTSGPADGDRAVTVGTATYVYGPASVTTPAWVKVTSAAPRARDGASAVIVVDDTVVTPVAAVPPNATVYVPENPVPEIVTVLPPVRRPEGGEMAARQAGDALRRAEPAQAVRMAREQMPAQQVARDRAQHADRQDTADSCGVSRQSHGRLFDLSHYDVGTLAQERARVRQPELAAATLEQRLSDGLLKLGDVL